MKPVMQPALLPITLGIATYNNHDDVDELVASINGQQGRFPVVICDGGSDEQFMVKLREICQPTTILTFPRKGIYDAYNKIVDHVNDGWIVLFGADDQFYTSNSMREMADALQGVSSDSVVAGKALTQATGHFYYVNSLSRLFSLTLLDYENTIHHQSVCIHKHYYRRHGGYCTSLRVVADHQLLIEARQRAALHLVDRIWSVSKRGGVSTSSTHLEQVRLELAGIRSLTGADNWRMRVLSQVYRLYRLLSVVRWHAPAGKVKP